MTIHERSALSRWLKGAQRDHPLLDARVPGEHLDAVDRVLGHLDAADPLRIPSKRKAFRTLTSARELSDQRAELLVASMLARARVLFEFAEHAPDIVLSSGGLGIEVTCRLADEPLEARTTRLGIELTEHFDAVERAVVAKIEEKAHQGESMPTLLVLNLDRAGWSWLRGSRMWATRIEPIVSRQRAFAGVGVVFSSWDRDHTTNGCLVVHSVAALEPHLTPVLAALQLAK